MAYVVFRKNVSIRTAKSWSYSKPLILKSKDRVISTGLKSRFLKKIPSPKFINNSYEHEI